MTPEPGSVFLGDDSVLQSPLLGPAFHVGIIMDGNGRWATARGRPREMGHRKGAAAVRTVVEAAPDAGITVLTLYAFTSDNWRRPVVGRRDRLHPTLLRAIEGAERETAGGRRLLLRLAVDYSARHSILQAARRSGELQGLDDGAFSRLLGAVMHAGADGAPDVDLLIRTGGEQRLSDFLLWECAYAELVFTPKMWPDFSARDLHAAVAEFRRRHRRFGNVAEAV